MCELAHAHEQVLVAEQHDDVVLDSGLPEAVTAGDRDALGTRRQLQQQVEQVDSGIEQHTASRPTRVELPASSGVRMATVTDEHVEAAQPPDLTARESRHEVAHSGEEAVVVADEAGELDTRSQRFQPARSVTVDAKRLLDQDGLAALENARRERWAMLCGTAMMAASNELGVRPRHVRNAVPSGLPGLFAAADRDGSSQGGIGEGVDGERALHADQPAADDSDANRIQVVSALGKRSLAGLRCCGDACGGHPIGFYHARERFEHGGWTDGAMLGCGDGARDPRASASPGVHARRITEVAAERRSARSGLFGQGIRFALAGGSVMAIYVASTTLLAKGFGLPFEAALPIGYVTALCAHFTLQRFFVWVHDAEFALALPAQATRYLVLAGLQYGLTAASTAVLPKALGASVTLVYLATVIVLTSGNFLALRNGVFHAG